MGNFIPACDGVRERRACVATGALQVVEATSVVINGQTIVITGGHSGGGWRR
jgi:hypothetical protein